MSKVLFVCLGNICRSPMAEGIFKEIVKLRGLSSQITCESAGTANYHVGALPDKRARETCQQHGILLQHQGRQLSVHDFEAFDYILAMDSSNFNNIKALGPLPETCRLFMMRDFDPDPSEIDVPDPYYGGMEGFEQVYQMLYRSNERFLDFLTKETD